MVLSVVFEDFDDMIGEGDRCVVAGPFFHRGKFDVILVVNLRIEESSLIFQEIGVMKAVFERHPVDMPFSGVVGAIAGRLKQAWKKDGPVRANAPVSSAGGNARHAVPPNLLGVEARQQCPPRRPAARRVVELGELQPICGNGIEMRGLDLSAITAEIGESKVIRKN